MGLLNETAKEYYNNSDGFGGYQFISLHDIISQFKVAYVGEDKIISKISRTDVAFHAQRALQELSFDTLKSIKGLEVKIPPSLQIVLPQDYVNYTKISCVDNNGIKRLLYRTNQTSNPVAYHQNEDGDFKINPVGTLTLNSNVIVLDGDYSDVLVHGMRVLSPNLPPGSHIHNVTTTSGITSITLQNKQGTSDKDALASTNERLEITRFAYLGSDLKLGNNSLTETTTTAAAIVGDTSLNLTSVEGIEEGMFINHPAFVNDNTVGNGRDAIKVIGVGTTTIELSHAAVKAVASGDTVGFISDNNNSKTWDNYKSSGNTENNNDYYGNGDYWPDSNSAYGLDPQYSQANGSFYIDENNGLIHFSSNISGKTVILDYISDSLGTDAEMQVHKFAEEAMYKCIAYAILSTKTNIQEYIVQRFKKERFAAVRTAKLRLSNIKLEELTQTLRGKSKQIKH
jgi:hypothetical protein